MDTKQIGSIQKIVKEAGQRLLKTESLQVKVKTSRKDLVTQADKETELFLREKLSEITPDCTFVGEEQGQELSEQMWIIDPIDGTTNFINLSEDYAISLAYYENYQPVLGIVYDVKRDTMYLAVSGQGAFINDEKVILNKYTHRLSEYVWDAGLETVFAHKGLLYLFEKTRGYRSMGCASLAIIKVALGKLDFYVSEHAKCWDYAAAVIFLQECQGSAWYKKTFFSCEANFSCFAGDDSVLQSVLYYL